MGTAVEHTCTRASYFSTNLYQMHSEVKTTILSFLWMGRSLRLQCIPSPASIISKLLSVSPYLSTIMIVYLSTLAFVATDPQCLRLCVSSYCHCSSPPSVTNKNRSSSSTPVCLLAIGEANH